VIAQVYLPLAEVADGTRFGRGPGLRRGGRIFAMLVRGSLVVKMPSVAAAEMVALGSGVPFDPRHGRLMGNWVEALVECVEEWSCFVRDAFGNAAHDDDGQRPAPLPGRRRRYLTLVTAVLRRTT
jgi:hypothetical protein